MPIDNQSLLNRFLTYVQIPSETGHEQPMTDRLVADLTAMGCAVTTDDVHDRANTTGANVYATLAGDPTLPPILFSAHMDTVTPGVGIRPQVCDDGYVRSDGTTILGGDDKAGICAIMEALSAAKDIPNRPTIEAAFTVREESGLVGAKTLDYSRILSKQCIVLDSSGSANDIIVGAPGQNTITATIIGRKAHAGVAPEEGISAIQVGAHAVAAMNLLRVDHETTCNIGTFSAAGATNIVTERVDLVLECRSLNNEKLTAHTQHLVDCMQSACDKFGATLECTVTTSYLGYHHDQTTPLVQRVFDACKAQNLTPNPTTSGGGSDANIYNQHGITALNLGVGMEKVHTTAEQLSIRDMEASAALCLHLMTAPS
ncbi:M20/M25/M40 family metallo-hydrolase [Bengtsoniella intestinalis]|uniref:M20/M25/M40 family metallo-hydrolase n=1 Tax=Bengtsoniella intestinalis TaxID=3073143 RepID=UPI00391F1D53